MPAKIGTEAWSLCLRAHIFKGSVTKSEMTLRTSCLCLSATGIDKECHEKTGDQAWPL